MAETHGPELAAIIAVVIIGFDMKAVSIYPLCQPHSALGESVLGDHLDHQMPGNMSGCTCGINSGYLVLLHEARRKVRRRMRRR